MFDQIKRNVKNYLFVGLSAIIAGSLVYAFTAKPNVENVSINEYPLSNSSQAENLPAKKKTIHYLNIEASDVLLLLGEVDGAISNKLSLEISELGSKPNTKPLYLLIDSPGGSVFDGAMIISAIEGSKRPVYTVCLKMCASMAAMIHSYGHKRLAVDRAMIMYHPASGAVQGQVENMMSRLNAIKRYVDKMDANVIGRSHVTRAEFEKLVAFEIWVDAEDATERGFNDGLVFFNIKSVIGIPGTEATERYRQIMTALQARNLGPQVPKTLVTVPAFTNFEKN